MKKINVLYTLDHKYVKYMLVSLYSLLENNKDIDITIHIICDKFEIEDYKIIESIISEFKNTNVFFYNFQKIENIIDEYNISSWRDKKIPNARLFFNVYIKESENLLYLDSDTIILNSLKGLKNYQGTISMVQDSMPKSHYQNLSIPLKKYYNSGVLWIDIKKWQENDCNNKIREILKENIPYIFPDQDIINMALKDEIKALPPEYNLFSIDSYFSLPLLFRYYNHYDIERYSKEELKQARNNPIILHSTPFYYWNGWQKKAIHPYLKYYKEYFSKLNMDLDIDENLIKKNPFLFKLFLYLKLMCPKEIKEKIKEYIKK